MRPEIFQLVVFFMGIIFTVMGVLITSNIKQFKSDIDKENKNQNNRLNSHSENIKAINDIVIKNEAELKANKENDINERKMFQQLLHSELKPIKSDLEYLKSKLP